MVLIASGGAWGQAAIGGSTTGSPPPRAESNDNPETTRVAFLTTVQREHNDIAKLVQSAGSADIKKAFPKWKQEDNSQVAAKVMACLGKSPLLQELGTDGLLGEKEYDGALSGAEQCRQPDVLAFLVDTMGAREDFPAGHALSPSSALGAAIVLDQKALLVRLLKMGADPNHQDLIIATIPGPGPSHGAPLAILKEGTTPLSRAIEHGNLVSCPIGS